MSSIRGRTRSFCRTRVSHWAPRRRKVYLLVLPGLLIRVSYHPRRGYSALTMQATPGLAGVTQPEVPLS